MKAKHELLLLEDVQGAGRSGDLVFVKPGFARNFLIPMKKAVRVSKSALRMQAKLREERAQQAAEDKAASSVLASRLEEFRIFFNVKVDRDQHLYGSVSAADIAKQLQASGCFVEKRHVILAQPLKKLGEYKIALCLNEGVETWTTVEILPEKEESSGRGR